MADLKIDLINKLGNDKYYAELELARLANDSNIPYQIKIDDMIHQLNNISKINSNIELIDLYFRVPVEVVPEVVPEVQNNKPVKTKLK